MVRTFESILPTLFALLGLAHDPHANDHSLSTPSWVTIVVDRIIF
jgi:hypothetical protein